MKPQSISLGAPLNRPSIEISGLAWYGDTLVLLPQYPSRHTDEDTRQLYGIPRAVLHRAVRDTSASPIRPAAIPIEGMEIEDHASQYEGCEALAFVDDQVFIVTEGQADGAGMRGQVLQGRMLKNPKKVRIRGRDALSLPQQLELPNTAYEALTAHEDTVVGLFEANGANVNRTPRAQRMSSDLRSLGSVSFPTLEYRLTDATSLDGEEHFWVINYFYPGDDDLLRPAVDSLRRRFGAGSTHRTQSSVERLVEYEYTASGIRRTGEPPLQLRLRDEPRNWEGLVRFGDGFLVATDRFPSTILAYVPGGKST